MASREVDGSGLDILPACFDELDDFERIPQVAFSSSFR